MSRSTDWIRSLVWAPARSQKIDDTWFSASPESSSAASVLSIVGGIGIAGDRRDLAVMGGERRFEHRRERLVGKLPEIRQVERPGPVGERMARKVDGLCVW